MAVPLNEPPWPSGRRRYVYLHDGRSGELVDLGSP
jgi:hypothetical protein